jgi:hypothetical protein
MRISNRSHSRNRDYVCCRHFFGDAASAQLSLARARCANKEKASPDLQISGCTTVIQSGKETQKNRVGAYTNRGNAFLSKKDYDRAIADYDRAVLFVILIVCVIAFWPSRTTISRLIGKIFSHKIE